MPEVVLEEILISEVSSPCIIQVEEEYSEVFSPCIIPVEEESKCNLWLSNEISFEDPIQKKDSNKLMVQRITLKDKAHSSRMNLAQLIEDLPKESSPVQSLEIIPPRRFVRNQEPVVEYGESLDTPVPDPSLLKSSGQQPDSIFPASEESKLDSSVVSHQNGGVLIRARGIAVIHSDDLKPIIPSRYSMGSSIAANQMRLQ